MNNGAYKITIKLKDGTVTTIRNDYFIDTIKIAKMLLRNYQACEDIRTMIITKYPLKLNNSISIVKNYTLCYDVDAIKEKDIIK